MNVVQEANMGRRGQSQVAAFDLFPSDVGEQVLITLPAGTVLHQVYSWTKTAFNGGGTTTLTVGNAGDPDAYLQTGDQTISSLNSRGISSAGSAAEKAPRVLSADTIVEANLVDSVASAAGQVRVFVHFTLCNP